MRRLTVLRDLARRLRESDETSSGPKNKGNDFELPTTHLPGTKVPKGGASCLNCRHFDGQGACNEEHFVAWQYGESGIPAPADEYCSDWWESKEDAPDVHLGPEKN